MSAVPMPRLSDSMEEGTVVKWLVEDGAPVAAGAPLVEVETDKATMTYEADAAGVVHHVAREGDVVAVGATIAHVLPAGTAPPEEGPPAAPTAVLDGAAPAAAGAPPGDAAAPPTTAERPRAKASPLARRLAREHGIAWEQLAGSGPRGRIVRADVDAAIAACAAVAPVVDRGDSQTAAPAGGRGEVRVVELSRAQQVVARRMAESKATIPEFTLTTTVDMTECVALRRRLAQLDLPATPSYNDMVVKAVALALRAHPRANASFADGRFELFSRVNVGVAVAVPDGLVVPTVFDADRLPLAAIAQETRRLAGRAREGSLTPPELSGGTFTVSNLGMYGVTSFTAIVNPPQAAILAAGAIEREIVPLDDQPVARDRMRITVTCDHRILYGADAAQFLVAIRDLLEQPIGLLLLEA